MNQSPPVIRHSGARHYIGLSIELSFSQNSTEALWKEFMPKRSLIKRTIGMELYSIDLYPTGFFDSFDPTTPFHRWAAVLVDPPTEVPANLDHLLVEDGLYAVFDFKGKPSLSPQFFDWIFSSWMPSSPYIVDNRPHLAVMGSHYFGEDDASEEKIWIPVKERS